MKPHSRFIALFSAILIMLSIFVFSTPAALAEGEDDCYLASLSVTNGSATYDLYPGFDKDVTSYKAGVEYKIDSVTITAAAESEVATVSGDTGVKSLSVGDNNFTVRVTADNLDTKDYSIDVFRSPDCDLKSLTVTNGSDMLELYPGFDPDTTSYKAGVDNGVDSVTIAAEADDSGASVSGDTGEVSLSVGDNDFKVTVTGSDGKSTKVYGLTITRAYNIQTYGDFEYEDEGTYVTVTGYSGKGGDVTVPDTIDSKPVKAIGDEAFSGDDSITGITFPGSIETIGSEVGGGCGNLISITFSSGLKSIGDDDFCKDNGLTSVTLPDTLTDLGNRPFVFNQSMESVLVEAGNTSFTSDDGVLFSADGKDLYVYPAGKAGVAYTMPDGVETVKSQSFGGNPEIVTVALPDSVKFVDNAFGFCDSMMNLCFFGDAPDISDSGIGNCSDDLVVYHTAGASGFTNPWQGYEAAVFDPNTTYTVTFDVSGHGSAPGAQTVYSGVRAAEPEAPSANGYNFDGWYTDTSYADEWYFPRDAVTVGTTLHAKWYAGTYRGFSFTESNGKITITGYGGAGGNLTVPSTIDGKPVVAIEDKVFYCDNTITKLIFPGSIKKIGFSVCVGCGNLKSVTFSSGLLSIDSCSFCKDNALKTVTLPDTLTSLGDGSFAYNDSLESILVDEDNTAFTSEDGVLFSADMEKLILYPAGIADEDYKVPDGVVEIGSTAFGGAQPASIELPDSVTQINGNAFDYCADLLNVFFFGDAPGNEGFGKCSDDIIVYYISGASGFTNPWCGYNTAVFDPNTTCTVTFDAEGQGTAPDDQDVYSGARAIEPKEPSAPGYLFEGWFKEDTFENEWDFFSDAVTSNITLYAKWQYLSPYLSGVNIDAGALTKTFIKTAYSYCLRLGEGEGSVTITPVKEYDGASMTINGKNQTSVTVSVDPGKTSKAQTVKVTANKVTKTYTFTVRRPASTNSSLSALTATVGTFDQALSPTVSRYVLTLGENDASTVISASALSPAKLSFTSKTVKLNPGDVKTVTLTVTAQSGAKRIYTIVVIRGQSTNAALSSIKLSSSKCTLNPALKPGTYDYSIEMPSTLRSFKLTVKAAGYGATVYMDDVVTTSETIALESGQSTKVTIVVVAQSGAVQEYDITVTRD